MPSSQTENPERPGAEAARAALDQAGADEASAFQRALYARWAAAIASVWAGALTWLILSESGWTVPAALAGIGFILWVHRRGGAAPREVSSRRDLVIVALLVSGFIGFVVIGALLAQRFQLAWAPAAIGAAFGLALYAVMELAYRKVWAAQAAARRAG